MFFALFATLASAVLRSAEDVSLSHAQLLLPLNQQDRVHFALEGHNGCFRWTSSNPEIASIAAVDVDATAGCSRRAVVTPSSIVTSRKSSWITAEDKLSGRRIRCEVFVDLIARIAITTTTKTMYKSEKEVLEVSAFDASGNKFSTLTGLAFQWSVAPHEPDAVDASHASLQLVPFSGSSYEIAQVVRDMELRGKQTSLVLVEGVATGRANVRARLVDVAAASTVACSECVGGAPHAQVTLTVLEPLVLAPSDTRFVVVGARVEYSLRRLFMGDESEARDGEDASVVAMPSAQYHWSSSNATVASVDDAGVVSARASGETTIRVAYARMPDTHYQATLVVVEAAYVALLLTPCANATQQRQAADALASDALQASGGVIHLSVGGVYCVDAFAFDVAAHRLDTARAALTLDIALDASRFETLRGGAGSADRLVVRARAVSPVTDIVATLRRVSGAPLVARESVVITAAVAVLVGGESLDRDVIVLPFDGRTRVHMPLAARGGSGHYEWRSSQSSVVTVSDTGVIVPHSLGQSLVTLFDKLNAHNAHTIDVVVVTASRDALSKLAATRSDLFAAAARERALGEMPLLKLQGHVGHVPTADVEAGAWLDVDALIALRTPTVLVRDDAAARAARLLACQPLPIDWAINGAALEFDNSATPNTTALSLPRSACRCASRRVRALRPGRSIITAKIDDQHAELEVVVHAPLEMSVVGQSSRDKLLLAHGASAVVVVSGGARGGVGEELVALDAPQDVTIAHAGGDDAARRNYVVTCLRLHEQTLALRAASGVAPDAPRLRLLCRAPHQIYLFNAEHQQQLSSLSSSSSNALPSPHWLDSNAVATLPLVVPSAFQLRVGRQIALRMAVLDIDGTLFRNLTTFREQWVVDSSTRGSWTAPASSQRTLALGDREGTLVVGVTLTHLDGDTLRSVGLGASGRELCVRSDCTALSREYRVQIVRHVELSPSRATLLHVVNATSSDAPPMIMRASGGSGHYRFALGSDASSAVSTTSTSSSTPLVSTITNGVVRLSHRDGDDFATITSIGVGTVVVTARDAALGDDVAVDEARARIASATVHVSEVASLRLVLLDDADDGDGNVNANASIVAQPLALRVGAQRRVGVVALDDRLEPFAPNFQRFLRRKEVVSLRHDAAALLVRDVPPTTATAPATTSSSTSTTAARVVDIVAQRLGSGALSATHGAHAHSQSLVVHMYAPLRLLAPTPLVLLSGASYQLSCDGGPPGADLRYEIAERGDDVLTLVDDVVNAALKPVHGASATRRVIARVVGSAEQAAIDVVVVAQNELHIASPAARVLEGNELHLHAELTGSGAGDDVDGARVVTPLGLGARADGLYRWQSAAPDVANVVAVHDGDSDGDDEAAFSTRLLARRHGTARIALTTDAVAGDVRRPALSANALSAVKTITVVERLRLLLPSIAVDEESSTSRATALAVLLAPRARLVLKTNKDGRARLSFRLSECSIDDAVATLVVPTSAAANATSSTSTTLATTTSNTNPIVLRAGLRAATTALIVCDEDDGQCVVVAVHVRPVHHIQLRPMSVANVAWREVSVGSVVHYAVLLRDALGSTFDSIDSGDGEQRWLFEHVTNAPDVIGLVATSTSNVVAVRGLRTGNAVLRVSVRGQSSLVDFVRVRVSSLLRPRARDADASLVVAVGGAMQFSLATAAGSASASFGVSSNSSSTVNADNVDSDATASSASTTTTTTTTTTAATSTASTTTTTTTIDGAWSIDDARIATIERRSGLLQAHAIGMTTVLYRARASNAAASVGDASATVSVVGVGGVSIDGGDAPLMTNARAATTGLVPAYRLPLRVVDATQAHAPLVDTHEVRHRLRVECAAEPAVWADARAVYDTAALAWFCEVRPLPLSASELRRLKPIDAIELTATVRAGNNAPVTTRRAVPFVPAFVVLNRDELTTPDGDGDGCVRLHRGRTTAFLELHGARSSSLVVKSSDPSLLAVKSLRSNAPDVQSFTSLYEISVLKPREAFRDASIELVNYATGQSESLRVSYALDDEIVASARAQLARANALPLLAVNGVELGSGGGAGLAPGVAASTGSSDGVASAAENGGGGAGGGAGDIGLLGGSERLYRRAIDPTTGLAVAIDVTAQQRRESAQAAALAAAANAGFGGFWAYVSVALAALFAAIVVIIACVCIWMMCGQWLRRLLRNALAGNSNVGVGGVGGGGVIGGGANVTRGTPQRYGFAPQMMSSPFVPTAAANAPTGAATSADTFASPHLYRSPLRPVGGAGAGADFTPLASPFQSNVRRRIPTTNM